jgi:hypothetical protein
MNTYYLFNKYIYHVKLHLTAGNQSHIDNCPMQLRNGKYHTLWQTNITIHLQWNHWRATSLIKENLQHNKKNHFTDKSFVAFSFSWNAFHILQFYSHWYEHLQVTYQGLTFVKILTSPQMAGSPHFCRKNWTSSP